MRYVRELLEAIKAYVVARSFPDQDAAILSLAVALERIIDERVDERLRDIERRLP